jgi:hypothetical protein
MVEECVRRLRKPVGAAQPGEANPVLVATIFCKRRRATKPQEGPSVEARVLRDVVGSRHMGLAHTLYATQRA